MKIFWQRLPAAASGPSSPSAASAAAPPFSSPERVALPAPLFACLRDALRQSAALLPAGTRAFGAWSVALLERFALADVGRAAEEGATAEHREGTPMRVATTAEIPIRVIPYSEALME